MKDKLKKILKTKRFWIFLLFVFLYYFCLPNPLFSVPYSTIVESEEGVLLGGKIAKDGQWRFPQRDSVPHKFKQAIIQYEDAYFYYHWGFNPVSIGKAFWQNKEKGKIVRGGSTITQQVIRLSRKKQRTYFEKLIEIILSTRLEFSFSKEKILALYASYAPFGGNVVGIDMASWRYFGVSPEKLSWAESCLLAVLPNSPSLVYPGKNEPILKAKRNRLLFKLFQNKKIDKATYELSLLEPIVVKPKNLPSFSPHLVEKLNKEAPQKRIKTGINFHFQQKINSIVEKYYNHYKQFQVHNMAVLVVDNRTMQVVSYVGNTPTDSLHQNKVNIIDSPRSTGSLLKPFLYAMMLDRGQILPQELLTDIPITISNYAPKNFSETFEGAVPADKALAKSLNIPFVMLLQQMGVYIFWEEIQKYNLKHLNKHPNHYGLSIILGGGETSLWDITQAYANLAKELNFFNKTGKYQKKSFKNLSFYKDSFEEEEVSVEKQNLSASSIWLTFEALTSSVRPNLDVNWQNYASSQKIAWKTGTSFGGRDAWSVGVTPDYTIGVWVGNATGEGRSELTGVGNASPVMFDIFKFLPKKSWFEEPSIDLKEIEVCLNSGLLALEYCPKKTIKSVLNTPALQLCPYHKLVHLSLDGSFRVNAECEKLSQMKTESWFVLPPIVEYFYKKQNLTYKVLPDFRKDCIRSENKIDFIYPKNGTQIYLTTNLSGEDQPFIASAVALGAQKVFWYLDDEFLGVTQKTHQMPIRCKKGMHYLKIVDENANEKVILINLSHKNE